MKFSRITTARIDFQSDAFSPSSKQIDSNANLTIAGGLAIERTSTKCCLRIDLTAIVCILLEKFYFALVTLRVIYYLFQMRNFCYRSISFSYCYFGKVLWTLSPMRLVSSEPYGLSPGVFSPSAGAWLFTRIQRTFSNELNLFRLKLHFRWCLAADQQEDLRCANEKQFAINRYNEL